jgi:hypothetical protein
MWGGLVWILSLGLSIHDSDEPTTTESQKQGIRSQFKEDFDVLAKDQCVQLQLHQKPGLLSTGLCEVLCQLMRYSVKGKNAKLLGNILDMVLLIVDKRQLFVEEDNVKSFLLEGSVKALVPLPKPLIVWPTEGFENSTSATLSKDLKLLLEEMSEILPSILPISSGFSLQAINFLDSKQLCIEWGCFGFDHLKDYKFFFKTDTQSKTTLPADSVLCAASASEDVKHIFDHVWMPFGPDRLYGYVRHFDETWRRTTKSNWDLMRYCITIPVLAVVFTVLALSSALAALALYPAVLIYINLLHGFGLNSVQQRGSGAAARGSADSASGDKISFNVQCSNEIPVNTSCTKSLLAFLQRPVVAFQDSLKGNQSVSRHMLCLPGMASLKMLEALLDAPIDVFEAPAVRAAVEGMWSRFRFKFYAHIALYVVQLLLFSAFARWCIATNASYIEIGEHSDGIVLASFLGGSVAAGIGCYFLARELLQCCSCVADEGLKQYIEFWNASQICSHSLELASFAMFVSGSDPTSTRLVATYAVFGLWINLLYFTKAIKQVSFLLEILFTILSDMIPFSFVMVVLIMAVTVALQVLTADLMSRTDSGDMQSISSFGTLFGYLLRLAEGRQDLAGSALEQLTYSVYEQSDLGPFATDAFVYTIYFCFYFLLLVITVVALNALIALMGSSIERVMEKRLSIRYLCLSSRVYH